MFAQNIDFGYTLEPPAKVVLMSTHNLCIVSKICIHLQTPIVYIKLGFIKCENMCFDETSLSGGEFKLFVSSR